MLRRYHQAVWIQGLGAALQGPPGRDTLCPPLGARPHLPRHTCGHSLVLGGAAAGTRLTGPEEEGGVPKHNYGRSRNTRATTHMLWTLLLEPDWNVYQGAINFDEEL